MYNFGKNSSDKLNTCHPDLQKVLTLAISRSVIDFGISEGYRSLERQKALYAEGKSTIDGVSKKGKHNYNPSMAADLYVYHPDAEVRKKIVYDRVHLAYIMGIVASCAAELLEKGEITHKVRFGMNWDSDGVIALDQSFDDFPHVELV